MESISGPFRCMNVRQQLRFQRYLIEQFHQRASRASVAQGPAEYRRAGLARLYEIRVELQDRQPWACTPFRVDSNYVMDQQKLDFVVDVINHLEGHDNKETEFLSTLWTMPKRIADQWMWGNVQCYFLRRSDEPVPDMMDLTPDYGSDDSPAAFDVEHRNEYLPALAAEEIINSDASASEGTDVLVIDSDGHDGHEDEGVQDQGGPELNASIQSSSGNQEASGDGGVHAAGRADVPLPLSVAPGDEGAAFAADASRPWSESSPSEGIADTHDLDGNDAGLEQDNKKRSADPDWLFPAAAKRVRVSDDASAPNSLGALEFEDRRNNDGLRLVNSQLPSKNKRKTMTQSFTRPRTSFSKHSAIARPPNAFDEERLVELFPGPLEDPQTAEVPTRRMYTLDQFVVYERGNPLKLVPLDHLLRFGGRSMPDVVVAGFASPLDRYNDYETGPQAGRTSDAAVEAREVRLIARWDLRSLHFTIEGGPKLVSRQAEYRLVMPRASFAYKRYSLRRKNPRSRPDQLAKKSYEPYAQKFKRLLNLYALARVNSVRGDYATVPAAQLDDTDSGESDPSSGWHDEVAKVARRIRELVKEEQQSGDLKWQDDIPFYWHVPVEVLKLDNRAEEIVLFRSLPDIPFVSPLIYKHVAPFFPPHTFRTEDVEAVKAEAETERLATNRLLAKYRKIVAEHLALQDEPAESQGPRIDKISPDFIINRTLKKKVKTWTSAVVNGEAYCQGDVVALPCPKDRTPIGTDEEDEEQMTDRGKAGSQAEPITFWCAVIEYFFYDRQRGDLMVHLSWFSVARSVPTCGPYSSPRMLFKLDRCDSLPATTISGRVEQPCDFQWVKGEMALPETGFFCSSTYNVDDGSIQDVSVLAPESWVKCDSYDITHCASCESLAAYIDSTQPLDDGSHHRASKAVLGDGTDETLFTLDGTAYHRDDTIYIEFHEDDMAVKPRNQTLPITGGLPSRARCPWRLGRIVDLAENDNEGVGDELEAERTAAGSITIEWLVREQELTQSPGESAYLSSHEVLLTNETASVPTVNVRGRFDLSFIDEGDPNLAATIAALEHKSTDAFWVRSRAVSAVSAKSILNEDGVLWGKVLREPIAKGDLRTCEFCKADKDEQLEQSAHLGDSERYSGKTLLGGALYSGGGLLDIGLEQGCPLLRTGIAIDKHKPALECLKSNFPSAPLGILQSVSDVNEEVFFRGQTDAATPGKLGFLSGGSPCQGFSKINRFKTLDDLRCAEPFVFLTSLAVFRPLHALYENVAAFETHSLPHPIVGYARQSFFRLFVAVATALRYQLRWTVCNAAGFGVPQYRSRIIVQLAASGMPLPEAPLASHALKGACARRDHRLLDERDEGGRNSKKSETAEDGAPHWAVSLIEAVDDLPVFGVLDCFEEQGYVIRPFGPDYDGERRLPYATPARTTFQQKSRAALLLGRLAFSGGVTNHVCRSLSETVARRVNDISVGGNHEDLKGKPWYPDPPPNVASSRVKLTKWWRRCWPTMIVTPLRTTISYDGTSQGERLHYSQKRPLSMRELLRIMGVPDWYELNLGAEVGDTAFDEQLRLIGNGVPVALAAAFGRVLAKALDPLVKAHLQHRRARRKDRTSNLFDREDNMWEKVWRELGSETLRAKSKCKAQGDDQRRIRRYVRDTSSVTSSGSSASSTMYRAPLWNDHDMQPDERDDSERTSLGTSGSGVKAGLGPDSRIETDYNVEPSDPHPATHPHTMVQAAAEAHEDDTEGDLQVEHGTTRGQRMCEIIELSDSDSDPD